jgi:TonB family protein
MEPNDTNVRGSNDTAHGHLSVRVEGAHPPEIQFLIQNQSKRLGWSFLATMGFYGMLIIAVVLVGRIPKRIIAAPKVEYNPDQIVWLDQPGPGGGGGGGGNKMPDPPKPAELPGKDKITVPVTKPAPVEAPKLEEKPQEVEAVQQFNIPAQTLAAAMQDMPGVISAPGPMSLSQGSGSGGGAGTGTGTGIGPGSGSGLGPGSGGGTGGGVYQIGSGVTSPVDIYKPKPNYTADAMRARIQGSVLVQCIVQPSGVCTDIQVVRSLDPTFGLDKEAIESVKKWKFRPGTRLGQAVPVQVTIEVEFALR